ncbi:MAG: type VI secretion system lipoprotein TssJ [Acetobacteraceae bacterium]
MGRWFRGLVGFLLLAAIAGCAGAPPPLPTVVNLTLTATADVNATGSGPGAPVQVRVYQLASTSAFDGADFFQLFSHDTATLGTDLVHVDQFLLAPGTSKTVVLKPNAQVTALGFFAAYGAYQSATWRTTTPVPAHKTTLVTATVGKAAVTVKAAPAPAGS